MSIDPGKDVRNFDDLLAPPEAIAGEQRSVLCPQRKVQRFAIQLPGNGLLHHHALGNRREL